MGAKNPKKKAGGSLRPNSAQVSVTMTVGLARALMASLAGDSPVDPQVKKTVMMKLLRATSSSTGVGKKGKKKPVVT
jgi:hypothetical protein